jgi:hypothetical protein
MITALDVLAALLGPPVLGAGFCLAFRRPRPNGFAEGFWLVAACFCAAFDALLDDGPGLVASAVSAAVAAGVSWRRYKALGRGGAR